MLEIIGLGVKDNGRSGYGLDTSDVDHEIHIERRPISSLFEPDAIARFMHQGECYLITANEGDVRDCDGFHEAARVADLTLDPVSFPTAAELQSPAQMGDLQVTRTMGDDDHDGKYEKLFALGGRSFSIWDASMKQVYDSGDFGYSGNVEATEGGKLILCSLSLLHFSSLHSPPP